MEGVVAAAERRSWWTARNGLTCRCQAAVHPSDLAASCDVLITMLADDVALQAFYVGPHGALAGLRTGHLVIDMSTVSPQASAALGRQIHDAAIAWTAPARRALARLPEKVATAVVEFLYGSLAANPQRVGKPLKLGLEGLHSARRGDYRVGYRIDNHRLRVDVVAIEHRSDIYRPRQL